MNKKIYLVNMKWNHIHDNIGNLRGEFVLNEGISYEDYIKLTCSMSFYLSDEDLQQENQQLKDNWNNLKKYLSFEIEFDKRWYCPESEEYTMQKHFLDDTIDGFQYILNKMQELEKGEE